MLDERGKGGKKNRIFNNRKCGARRRLPWAGPGTQGEKGRSHGGQDEGGWAGGPANCRRRGIVFRGNPPYRRNHGAGTRPRERGEGVLRGRRGCICAHSSLLCRIKRGGQPRAISAFREKERKETSPQVTREAPSKPRSRPCRVRPILSYESTKKRQPISDGGKVGAEKKR